jgi:hypothetical protein
MIMSLRAERIIRLSKKLADDRDRVAEEKRVLLEVNEQTRFEVEEAKKKANNEQCAGVLMETGVVEIFEELQKCFPGSEVLKGCEGSRISLVLPAKEKKLEARFEHIRLYHYTYRHITVRVVNGKNFFEHQRDSEKGHDYGFVGHRRKDGLYVGNERVEDVQALDEYVARKLSLIDDVFYEDILKTVKQADFED